MTKLQSLRNQGCKIFNIETEKVNELLKDIPTDNITECKELIYAAAKPISNKIDIHLKTRTEI